MYLLMIEAQFRTAEAEHAEILLNKTWVTSKIMYLNVYIILTGFQEAISRKSTYFNLAGAHSLF